MSKAQQMDTLQGYFTWALEGYLGCFTFPGCSGSGFLGLCAVDSYGRVSLCGRGHPVPRRMFSSVLGLYPLDASSTPPHQCDSDKCRQTLPNVLWGTEWPRLRTTAPVSWMWAPHAGYPASAHVSALSWHEVSLRPLSPPKTTWTSLWSCVPLTGHEQFCLSSTESIARPENSPSFRSSQWWITVISA